MVEPFKKAVEEPLGFNPSFVYGLTTGISLLAFYLIYFNGFYTTINGPQIYTFHVIWLCVVFTYFFHRREKDSLQTRLYTALAMSLLLYFIHDSLWALKQIINIYTGQILPNINLAILYPRNITVICCALFYLRKKVNLNWKTYILIPIQFIFWIYQAYYPITFPVAFDVSTMLLDFIPYLFFLRQEEDIHLHSS